MRGWTQLLLPNHWNRRRNRLVSRCEFGSARSHRLDESRRWVKNIVLVDPDHTRVALREKQMLKTTLTAVALSAALVMDIDTDLRLEGAGMVLAQAEIRIPSDSQLERLERRGIATPPLDVSGSPVPKGPEESQIDQMDRQDKAIDDSISGCEVLGPIALIIGLWPRWTALVLVVLTVVTTWATYRFGVFTAIFRQPQPVQLMKSLAVIAGLLFYFTSGPGGWSRTSLRRG